MNHRFTCHNLFPRKKINRLFHSVQPIPVPGKTGEGFGGELNHQLHSRPCITPQQSLALGTAREGFGGEKAARKSASLPVPTNHQTTNRPIIAPQQSFRSASGEEPHRPTAAESDSDPYAAPAPCRTPGGRGAADTPPAAHDQATLPDEALCRTPGVRGRGRRFCRGSSRRSSLISRGTRRCFAVRRITRSCLCERKAVTSGVVSGGSTADGPTTGSCGCWGIGFRCCTMGRRFTGRRGRLRRATTCISRRESVWMR